MSQIDTDINTKGLGIGLFDTIPIFLSVSVGVTPWENTNKTYMGEPSLNSGHHFGLYAALSELEAKAPYMATIFRVQGPLANHR